MSKGLTAKPYVEAKLTGARQGALASACLWHSKGV